jgi:hypothetical protein
VSAPLWHVAATPKGERVPTITMQHEALTATQAIEATAYWLDQEGFGHPGACHLFDAVRVPAYLAQMPPSLPPLL